MVVERKKQWNIRGERNNKGNGIERWCGEKDVELLSRGTTLAG